MSDLAKLAGVSKSTVSRALAGSELVNEETRAKVKQLATKHGYRLNTRAQNFRLKKVLTIGVLLPSNGTNDWLASNPFVLEMLGSISDELELRGHELLLAKHSNNDPSWIEDFAVNRSVDGIIVLGQSIYHDVLNRLGNKYKNMVVWGELMDDQSYSVVGSDNYLGGTLAAKYFLNKNKKNLAFIGNTDCPESRQRYKGYITTLQKAKVDAITLKCADNQDNISSLEIKKFLTQHPQLDAIFASSDMLAISTLKVAHDLKRRVPEDLGIIGYDNITLAKYTNPALSSIDQDRKIAGQILVQKLFEIINEGATKSERIITQLIERDSA